MCSHCCRAKVEFFKAHLRIKRYRGESSNSGLSRRYRLSAGGRAERWSNDPHGHVEGHRIDAALEKLVALGGAFHARSEPTGGRPATLWSAIQKEEREENEESGAEDDEPPVEE